MKESFNKNDRALKAYFIIFSISLALLALACFVAGIYVASEFSVEYGLLLLFGGVILCFLFWMSIRLKISFWVDVKLIRNKLYNKDNSDLAFFIEINKIYEIINASYPKDVHDAKTNINYLPELNPEQLEKIENKLKACPTTFDKVTTLNNLLSDKVISQADYDYFKNKILNF